MKKIFFIVCIGWIIFSAFMPAMPRSGIHGSIEPAESAAKVTAISGTDSVSTVPVAGRFSLSVKPGNWLLVIEAVKPYRSTTVESILVLENQSTDAGVIRMKTE